MSAIAGPRLATETKVIVSHAYQRLRDAGRRPPAPGAALLLTSNQPWCIVGSFWKSSQSESIFTKLCCVSASLKRCLI